MGLARFWPPVAVSASLLAVGSGRSAPSAAGAPQASGQPAVTLLYQNFPNPFPTTQSNTTCIWFDLNRPSTVRLTIHDVRGGLVRQIVPGSAGTATVLAAGRYGRAASGGVTGCDLAYSWDGRDDAGRVVASGVYLLRLRAEAFVGVKKILFRGR